MDSLDNLLLPPLPTDKTMFVQNLTRTIDLYLCGEIKEPEYYMNWLNTINTASENDIIFIHINSPGGFLNTTMQLRDSLINCPAHTIASVEGECCSGATMIFLACKETRMSKNARFMIHSYSGGAFGKAHEIYSSIDFDKDWFKNLCEDVYGGFLTEDEIKEVLDGKDFWFNADETYKRLIEFKKRFEEENKKEEKKQEEKPEKKKVKVVHKKKEKK